MVTEKECEALMRLCHYVQGELAIYANSSLLMRNNAAPFKQE